MIEPVDDASGDGVLDPTLPMGERDGARAATEPSTVPTEPVLDFAELRTIDSDNYVLGEELARGGMGRILRARDRRLGRPVAIKELLYTSADMRARFEREARITARLQHPAIVNIIEAGVWPNGDPFYVMKLVSGESLEKAIARRASLDERMTLLPSVIAAVDALAYAHDKEVVHRDLKPANILVGQFGETVVIDWGLAKDLSDRAWGPEQSMSMAPMAGTSDETAVGAVMGTPAYMSHEQATGKPVDARGDVYALGAILYHLVVGAAPYTGESSQDVLHSVVAEPPPPIAASSGAPLELVAIVEKAMARDAADRYHDASELAAELRRFSAGQRVNAHRYTAGALVRRWIRRHRVLVGAAAILVLAGIFGLVLYVRAIAAEQHATEHALTLADEQRAVAERSRDAATTQTMRLLEEQGRARMALGEPLQALAYLSKSYAMGNTGTAIRYLLARALPAASAIQLVSPPPTRVGPTMYGNTAFFTSDSQRGVVYSDDGLRIFDLEDGHLIAHLASAIRPILVPAQGRPLAVLIWPEPHEIGAPLRAAKGESAVLDLTTGRVQVALEPLPPTAALAAVAIDDDGDLVAIASADGTLRLSDGRSGKTRWSVHVAGPSPVLALSPGGTFVMTVGPGGCAIRRTSDGQVVRVVRLVGDEAQCMFGQTDGTLLVIRTTDNADGRYDLRTGGRIPFTATKQIKPTEFVFMRPVASAAMARFATVDFATQQVAIWSGEDGRRLSSFATGRRIEWLAYDHAQKTVAVTTSDMHLRLWDTDTGVELGDLAGAGISATLSPDGHRVMARRGSTWSVWSVAALRRAIVIPAPAQRPPHTALAYALDGGRLAVSTRAGVEIVDPDRGVRLAVLATAPPRSLSFAPDGDALVTTTGTAATILNARTGAVEVSFGTDLATVQWAPKGDAILGGAKRPDGLGYAVWRRDGSQVRAGLHAGTWLPDGKTIVTSDGAFVDAASGTIARQLPLASTFTSTTRDGTTLVNGGQNGHIDVWNVVTGTRTSFETQSRPYLGGITPDGSLVIAVDEALRVWDTQTGNQLDVLDGPVVLTMAIRPTGTQVAARSEDGAIRLWDVGLETRSPREIAALVKQNVPWFVDDGGRLVAVPPSSGP